MRYLSAEAGSHKYYLEQNGDNTDGWQIIDPTNKDIFESLRSKCLSPWDSFNVAKNGITRAINDLRDSGLICVYQETGKSRLIGVGMDFDSFKGSTRVAFKGSTRVAFKGSTRVAFKGSTRVAQGVHKGSTRVAQGVHKGSTDVDSTAVRKARSALKGSKHKIKEYKENNGKPQLGLDSFINSHLGKDVSNENPGENPGEAKTVTAFFCSTDVTSVELPIMRLSPERIKDLHEFILELGEHFVFAGGEDNADMNLEPWINSPAYSTLVAPWMAEPYEKVKYKDEYTPILDEYDMTPGGEHTLFNRLVIPRIPELRDWAMKTYTAYAVPFNNGYLTPEKKGLAFIRQFPYGYPVRDYRMHPWSAPLIPWAVVVDDSALYQMWKKKYLRQGRHPFAPDTTTQKIRLAIKDGARETPHDDFFQDSKRDFSATLPGARSSMIVNPGPYHLLIYICGTLGISPSSLGDLFKRWETYSGSIEGVRIDHPSNANYDKIRMFINYLHLYQWGDKNKGSWIPREQGQNGSLHSTKEQVWSHQGLMGGHTVLVKCYDGNMREAWLNDSQMAIYNLKFHAYKPEQKELLEKLLDTLKE